MTSYIPTIGLEIHAELKTRTKMFCDCRNDPGEKKPNANICPVCLAHPGTLPVINKEAVRNILRVGVAIGGQLADWSEFDRKSYFYPDIPKGYQISQYKHPLVSGGILRGVEVTRVHLEEDTARSLHEREGETLLDFNRAGVPLMELVTEPVIHDTETAVGFAKELQLLLRALAAGDANLEKGEMRVEANISIAEEGKMGTKVEVKNLNSFRTVERAINFEVKRQTEVLRSGGEVVQETRGWDDSKGETFSQRLKESSHDYRYFPDPDLPKLHISEIPEFSEKTLRNSLPELPSKKRERYEKEIGLSSEYSDILTSNTMLGEIFDLSEKNFEDKKTKKLLANYIISDVQGVFAANPGLALTATVVGESVSSAVKLIEEGKLSSRGAKDALSLSLLSGETVESVAKREGFIQESNPEALREIVKDIIKSNPTVVLNFKSGKVSVIQFMVGQAIKATKGAGNPTILKAIFEEEIGKTK
ncbi:MAG: Asp-tRNA(Asn)/Glu-tRNA(Gln) amidotransferase subunit GatB [Patescibacteria group bacterium]